jgi:hypothetical protein
MAAIGEIDYREIQLASTPADNLQRVADIAREKHNDALIDQRLRNGVLKFSVAGE